MEILKWNPHIHCLISEGGAGNFTPWRTVKHFNYTFLRNAFRKVLLEQMTKAIGPSFRKVKNDIYKKSSISADISDDRSLPLHVLTVMTQIPLPFITHATKTVKPSRNVFLSYFIKRLIVHIPEKHFKMLRYYGLYAKHHKQERKLRRCLSPEKKAFFQRHLDWRRSILISSGYDPLRCTGCVTSMLVLEVYHKKTALLNDIERS